MLKPDRLWIKSSANSQKLEFNFFQKIPILNHSAENFHKVKTSKIINESMWKGLNRKTYQNLPLLICVEFAHEKNRTTDLPIYQRIAPLTIETNSTHSFSTSKIFPGQTLSPCQISKESSITRIFMSISISDYERKFLRWVWSCNGER
jgi:hypothetical protein